MFMTITLTAETLQGIKPVAITADYTPFQVGRTWKEDVCDKIDGLRATDPNTGEPVVITPRSAERVALATLNLCKREYDRYMRDVSARIVLGAYA